jgi:hypothetical protein
MIIAGEDMRDPHADISKKLAFCSGLCPEAEQVQRLLCGGQQLRDEFTLVRDNLGIGDMGWDHRKKSRRMDAHAFGIGTFVGEFETLEARRSRDRPDILGAFA